MNTRASEVVKLRKASVSYAEIGRQLGISRECARQIATNKAMPPKHAEPKPLKVMLTVTNIAQWLGVCPNTLRRWSDRGIIRAYCLGPRRDRRFHHQDVEAFLKEQ